MPQFVCGKKGKSNIAFQPFLIALSHHGPSCLSYFATCNTERERPVTKREAEEDGRRSIRRRSVGGRRRGLQVGLTPIMEYHTLRYPGVRSFGTQTRGSGKVGEEGIS